MIHHKRQNCRACGNSRLALVLPMGEMPLANSFLKGPEEFETEKFFPLDVYFCEKCSLLQLLDVIDPGVLFGNYIYVTGTSKTMSVHNEAYADSIVAICALQSRDLVIEIASNDGSLLRCFDARGIRTLGVEPATNIANIARSHGIETINEFFNADTAAKISLRHGSPKIIIANNVLAHVDRTQDFLKGCWNLVTDDGFVVIEVPYLRELLQNLEYDTIYHEHLCYFSVTALLHLFEAARLGIKRIDFVPVHGGTIRIFACKDQNHSDAVVSLAEKEEADGMRKVERYHAFAAAVQQNRSDLRRTLQTFRDQQKRVAAYGAPAKGNTLLNYCNIGTDLVSFTVDKSPLKVGLLTPGKHLPVRAVSALEQDQPDYALLLAWNYRQEVLRDQQMYLNRGGRFIMPIPVPAVIGS